MPPPFPPETAWYTEAAVVLGGVFAAWLHGVIYTRRRLKAQDEEDTSALDSQRGAVQRARHLPAATGSVVQDPLRTDPGTRVAKRDAARALDEASALRGQLKALQGLQAALHDTVREMNTRLDSVQAQLDGETARSASRAAEARQLAAACTAAANDVSSQLKYLNGRLDGIREAQQGR